MSEPEDPQLEALLVLLRDERGFDFTGYKRASLTRRVQRRMQQVGIESYADYLDHLQVSPDEYTALFNTLLINVTSFFRDPQTWDYLASDLLPRMLAGKSADAPIRLWSAGCASGEEAYTLAIILAEALGVEQFRERVKIYATDVDEEALAQARSAVFTQRDVGELPATLVERYFERTGQRYVIHKDLRRSVIFGRNDVVQDAPISHIDLLTCRNTLMYFNSETQARVLQRFNFALQDGGLLLLGKAEMLLARSDLFVPVDVSRRYFRKIPRSATRERPSLPPPEPPVPGQHGLHDLAFHTAPLAQFVVSPSGRLLLLNQRAETLFGVTSRDVGRPFQDLELSYRPADVRSLVDQAWEQRRPVWAHNVAWTRNGEQLSFDVQVVPLTDAGGVLGAGVAFHDVTRSRRLHDELERSNRQLESAYEELRSTNEELETTNEELQSTVEELETTNEELQSTNEELETMNEELQSTNDEFQAINEELRERTDDVDALNGFMESVLTSLGGGVVVLDPDLRISVWNRPAEDMWGLRQDEAIGEHLLGLDIGLPVGELRPALRAILNGEENRSVVLTALDRRGRQVQVRILVSGRRLGNVVAGVVLLMEFDTPADIVLT